MNEAAIEHFRLAGRLSAQARELGASMIDEGVSLLEVAEEVEGLIVRKGGRPAFPVNISINEQAAHYTPSSKDKLRFIRGDVVKLDVGAQIDGYAGDTATTVEVRTRNWSTLIEAAENALGMATQIISAGVPINVIGATIERSIRSSGYRPVINLTGHEIKRYNLHAGLTVPNVEDDTTDQVQNGMVLAVEPFATNGEGIVNNGKKGNIYRVLRERPIKDENAMKLFRSIVDEFGTLPFCERWCQKLDPKATPLLNKLLRHGLISSYAILEERGGCYVSQAEHTILIHNGKGEITTMP